MQNLRLDYPLLGVYIAFSLPIAIYCLILAQVNRRHSPFMVSGPWDCLGMLFAGSGIFLVGGPSFIIRHFRVALDDAPAAWIGYYLFILSASLLLIRLRNSVTVIYNVDGDLLNQVLERVLDKLELPMSRIGHAVMIGRREAASWPAEVPSSESAEHAQAIRPGRGEPRYRSLPVDGPRSRLDVEPFPAMSNVTLHWRSGSLALRQDVEDELRRNLDECRALDNPTAAWFFGISCLLFGFVAVVLALVVMVDLRS